MRSTGRIGILKSDRQIYLRRGLPALRFPPRFRGSESRGRSGRTVGGHATLSACSKVGLESPDIVWPTVRVSSACGPSSSPDFQKPSSRSGAEDPRDPPELPSTRITQSCPSASICSVSSGISGGSTRASAAAIPRAEVSGAPAARSICERTESLGLEVIPSFPSAITAGFARAGIGTGGPTEFSCQEYSGLSGNSAMRSKGCRAGLDSPNYLRFPAHASARLHHQEVVVVKTHADASFDVEGLSNFPAHLQWFLAEDAD